MTKADAIQMFHSIYDAASAAGAKLPKDDPSRATLHLIRNIALKAIRDVQAPTKS